MTHGLFSKRWKYGVNTADARFLGKSKWRRPSQNSAMIFHHHFVSMLRLFSCCLCPSPGFRHGFRHGLFRGGFDIYREDLRDDRKDRDLETAPKTPHIRGSFSHSATSSRLSIDLSLKPGADCPKQCRKIGGPGPPGMSWVKPTHGPWPIHLGRKLEPCHAHARWVGRCLWTCCSWKVVTTLGHAGWDERWRVGLRVPARRSDLDLSQNGGYGDTSCCCHEIMGNLW